MKLSFAVTAYHEMEPVREHGQRLLRAIAAAEAHPAVSEIVVVDDGSPQDQHWGLGQLLLNRPKVALHHNEQNLGVFGNKLEAITRATGDWVIACDSDNRMDAAYIDKLLSQDLSEDCWYCSSFARPKFDYRPLIGTYTLASIGDVMDRPMFACLINTGNQTVHRGRFMERFGSYRGKRADLMLPNWGDIPADQRDTLESRLVFDACDSLIFNFLWLQRGGRLAIVDGLEYDHYWTRGPESNYVRAPQGKTALNAAVFEAMRVYAAQAKREELTSGAAKGCLFAFRESSLQTEATPLASECAPDGFGATPPYLLTRGPKVSRPATVLVVGMPRGGTSVVAGVLDALGVYMGATATPEVAQMFESDVLRHGTPGEQAAEVERLNGQHELWGWKNSNGVHAVRNLPDGVRNPCAVFVFRDLAATYQGRYHNMAAPHAESALVQVASESVELIMALAEVSWPTLILSYERAKADPLGMVASLVAFLGLEPTGEQVRRALGRVHTGGGYHVPAKEASPCTT